ncbi:O-methyltransferase family 2 [Penicillium cf. griseofulvum]|uniref:O-methyltransferase family 2 n=1 Tax=Penicillium cf. griseofulvum TaxID=2972120 RepID=A0A9W9IUR5_9EURO|nr:O-methyltransferase family 2 [Penicillium cf. griseofulvum]KAJ5429978.1 O-methyltransferase family 2 [Penicillium cf. griseofulvum]KAJ5436247.1 O-methyltransferase family 2 [Penicillium cf. griseofulvum]
MDSIIAQIQALAENTDEAGRLNIIQSLKRVKNELQSPKDTLMELAVPGLTNAMLRISADLGLLRSLTRSDVSLSITQIAELTGGSPPFLERILRYLAAIDMVKETGVNEYAANNITHALAGSKGEAMIYHGFDTLGPVVQAMPAFFAENNYQDVTVNTNTPFQKAHNTKLTSFEWLVQQPKHFGNLQKIMTALQGSEWTEGFNLFNDEARKVPFKFSSAPPEKPFFVDVGGGHGHQCIELGKKYPNLLGYLVLQDLPEAVENLAPIDGVKAEAYDFFQAQPIIGAKFYYLRRIMHDWPDDKAAMILRNILAAMSPDSRILIDDAVLPDTGANWQSAVADLAMMTFAGKERMKHQWELLVESAGLRVEQIHTYVASTYTAVLVLAAQ